MLVWVGYVVLENPVIYLKAKNEDVQCPRIYADGGFVSVARV